MQVRRRNHKWKSKFLSFAGRRQLIISVLQSMQLYWMSVFILPSGVVHDLEALFRSFLWAQGDRVRGKCRIAWDVVCKPLHSGGLGFRRLAVWNRALVAKHLWDILSLKPTLWVRWVILHYIPNGRIWGVVPRTTWSWVFREIFMLRTHIRQFVVHKIGDGRNTNAWFDKWLMDGSLSELIPYRRYTECGFSQHSMARDVIQVYGHHWPLSWVQYHANLQNMQIPPLDDMATDAIKWIDVQNNLVHFTVRVAWKSLGGAQMTIRWTKSVWFKGCIPKHGFCMWMAFHNRLPTQDRIILWKQEPPDMKCALCEQVVDSHRHLFFTCPFSVTIWRQIKKEVDLYGFYEDWDAIVDALDPGRGPKLLIQKLALEATVYFIWRERNRRLFQDVKKTEVHIVQGIRDVVMLRMAWKHRRSINSWL